LCASAARCAGCTGLGSGLIGACSQAGQKATLCQPVLHLPRQGPCGARSLHTLSTPSCRVPASRAQPFCWLCGQGTGMQHTWTSIANHSCGRFKDELDARMSEAARNHKRYMFYFERFKNHADSIKKEKANRWAGGGGRPRGAGRSAAPEQRAARARGTSVVARRANPPRAAIPPPPHQGQAAVAHRGQRARRCGGARLRLAGGGAGPAAHRAPRTVQLVRLCLLLLWRRHVCGRLHGGAERGQPQPVRGQPGDAGAGGGDRLGKGCCAPNQWNGWWCAARMLRAPQPCYLAANSSPPTAQPHPAPPP
jgi:hypothetical protein